MVNRVLWLAFGFFRRYAKSENQAEMWSVFTFAAIVILLKWPDELGWIQRALLDFLTLILGG